MERNMRMVVVALFGVVAAVMLQCAAAQTAHVVGDSSGWIVPPNGAQAYVSWASNKTFVVGDTLIFNFATNAHDVLQVTKDSYDACTDTNPIGNPITTGPANITLTTAGDHYYICTYGRHCASGQKLAITVSATGTPGAAPPPSTTAAPPPPPPSTPSPTSSPTPEACAPEPSATNPTAAPPPPPPSTPSPTTPEACAPEPSATPPTASGPTTSTTPGQVSPPTPDSSSPAVFGGFFVSILSIAMAAFCVASAAAQRAHVVEDSSLGWNIPPNGAEAFQLRNQRTRCSPSNKDSYDVCNSTSPIGSPFTIGPAAPANITLTSAGDHYYICTYGSHCQMGQKLAITVSAAGTPGAAPTPSTTAPPPPPSTPSPTSGTTPEACAPVPSTTTPSAGGPTTTVQVPLPPPDSSSPAVFGGFFPTILTIAVVALF
ncbi:hypothetical protein RHSIM_Rhsim08G0213300 [Rhododendron simsii]|uniref:Phytocyanin domain-containing protein n=1 Tax=Rhododendron simsii TaxID=118357 RepID=A0A834GID6_RHOSS|nr:hypothetical protein RHSIM_Rhsim08G0213300 [Rhododendron simsii]